MRMAALLGANALMLVAGLGMLPLLGIARSWRLLVFRCGLAYLCGLVLVGIVSAHLALVQVSFGWIGLVVMAALSLAFCAWRLNGTERPGWRRPGWIGAVGFAALVALIVDYGRAFRVAPLNRYDAWAIWALKGHALYAFGWADPVVFAGASYRFANLDYPVAAAVSRGDRLSRDGRVRHAAGARAVLALPGRGTAGALRAPARSCACRHPLALALRPCAGAGGVRPVAHRVCRSPACAGVRRRRRGGRPVGGHERTLGARACDVLLCRRIADEERGLAVRSRSLSRPPGRCPCPLARAGRRGGAGRPAPASLAHLRPHPQASATSTTASATASTTSICAAGSASGRSRSGRSPARCSIPPQWGLLHADLRRPARSRTADRPAGAAALRTRLDDRRLARDSAGST